MWEVTVLDFKGGTLSVVVSRFQHRRATPARKQAREHTLQLANARLLSL